MKTPTLPLLTLLLLAACGNPPAEPGTTAPTKDTLAPAPAAERPDIVAPADASFKLVEAPPAAQFPDAALKLDTLIPNDKKMDAEFKFTVNGFELKAQTPDASTRGCANSAKGQHIHFILNNAPYKAEYNSDFTAKVDPGYNVALCFLSRSYHQSLKNNKAVVVKEFTMPGKDSLVSGDITKDPTLFYSRPKGTYKQMDGDKILLDFYLLNTDLMQGYSVRATIDGKVWTINKWAAYYIEGLKLGEHTVRLELVDGDGNLVPGPFNDSGTRSFSYLGS